jgi:hypothetical protein
MPVALYSFMVNSGRNVRIGHVFLAPNETEAYKLLEKHAAGCPSFGPAHRAGETIEIAVDVETLPVATEESLEEFLDLEDDEPEEEVRDPEEEEEEVGGGG